MNSIICFGYIEEAKEKEGLCFLLCFVWKQTRDAKFPEMFKLVFPI